MKSEKICLLCAAKRKQYYQNNKENIKNKSKVYYENNIKSIKIKQKFYYQNNKVTLIERQKQYYQNNIDEKKQYNEKYYQDNKEKIVKQVAQYTKNRKLTDPSFKLRKRISADIWKALKNNNSSKINKSITKYLPYSIQELKEYLEKQFEPWMTWGNWGTYNIDTWNDDDRSTWTWNIDHIIPHSNFKYTSMEDEDFKKCWSLENLRPLSSKENLKKNKY